MNQKYCIRTKDLLQIQHRYEIYNNNIFISFEIVFVLFILIVFSYYWQEAAEELAPRLEIILQHLMCAFGKYQVGWYLIFTKFNMIHH